MKSKKIQWERLSPGLYQSRVGSYVCRVESIEVATEGASSERGWHLFAWKGWRVNDMVDGYCDTFSTAKEAKSAASSFLESSDN